MEHIFDTGIVHTFTDALFNKRRFDIHTFQRKHFSLRPVAVRLGVESRCAGLESGVYSGFCRPESEAPSPMRPRGAYAVSKRSQRTVEDKDYALEDELEPVIRITIKFVIDTLRPFRQWHNTSFPAYRPPILILMPSPSNLHHPIPVPRNYCL